MAGKEIVVSNDWTKNWQAKIAVKTTAIFLWMVISVTFLGIILLNHNLVENIERDIGRDVEATAIHVQRMLLEAPVPDDADGLRSWRERLLTSLDDTYLQGLTLDIGERSIDIGVIPVDGQWQSLDLPVFLPAWSDGQAQSLRITAHYPDLHTMVRTQRDGVLVIIALAILAIGIILSWTIQNVLAKPFEVLVDATQQVSRGNLDLRLDVDREDEFGKLSRFFNEMMDTIKDQQDKLSRTNEELLVEIAERKRAEHELKSHRDHLEREVVERTRDLQAARDQALEASKAKSAFIANISHEIRTPLTPIIGFAEALLDEGDISRQQRASLRTIIRNSRHLLTLINDILDLSKIEANRLAVEKLAVNPFDLLQDLESLVGMQAREKGLDFDIQYEYPMPGLITSDPLRLKQILMNLATNAVKFTERGFVRVTASYDASARQLLIEVADSGIGISEDKRKQLFQAFSQADSSTTREYGGTGLGLYISQRLARMLGGGIGMDSVPGIGSRFMLRTDAGPVRDEDLVTSHPRPTEASEPDAAMPESGTVRGRVLVAEDSPDNQQLIRLYLQRLGAEVTLCENGKLAVEAALRQHHDLILMDMQMPVMSGLEAVEQLRSRGYRGPIYALTANAMKEDEEKYLRSGCDGFLAKPIEKAGFNRVILQYLGNRDEQQRDEEEDAQYRALVGRFVAGLPGYAREIETGLEHGDWESVASLSHQLKGMGGSFGFPELSDLAERLQQQLKEGRRDTAPHTIRELLELIRAIAA
jgi:signal transduction histidine kinase/FixJ family two-component response regulator